MLREAGFPGLEINGWIGILAPAGDAGRRSAPKLNSAVNAAVGKPAVNARLRLRPVAEISGVGMP